MPEQYLKIINPQTNESRWEPESTAREFIKAGPWVSASGQTVVDIDTGHGGRTYSATLDPSSVSELAKSDTKYSVADHNQLQEERVAKAREREYGEGTLANLGALSTGMARGLTAGFSDPILGAIHGREVIGGLREANPVLSPVGNVAGALLGVGIGAGVAGGAQVGSLGKALANMPASALVRAEIALEGAAPTLARSALSSAASGALYEAGQGVSAAYTNLDEEFSAEAVAENIMHYGLWGTAGGATGAILGRGLVNLGTKLETQAAEKVSRTGKALGKKGTQIGKATAEGGAEAGNQLTQDDSFSKAAREAMGAKAVDRADLEQKYSPVFQAQRDFDNAVEKVVHFSEPGSPPWEEFFAAQGRIRKDAGDAIAMAYMKTETSGNNPFKREIQTIKRLENEINKATAKVDPIDREVYRSVGGKKAVESESSANILKYAQKLDEMKSAVDDLNAKGGWTPEAAPEVVNKAVERIRNLARGQHDLGNDELWASVKPAVEAYKAAKKALGKNPAESFMEALSTGGKKAEKALSLYDNYLKATEQVTSVAMGGGKQYLPDALATRDALVKAWEAVNGKTAGTAVDALNAVNKVIGGPEVAPIAKEADELLKATTKETGWVEKVKSLAKGGVSDVALAIISPPLAASAMGGRMLHNIAKAVAPLLKKHGPRAIKATGRKIAKTRGPGGAVIAGLGLSDEKSPDIRKQYEAVAPVLAQGPAVLGKRSWDNLKSLRAANPRLADKVQAQTEAIIKYIADKAPVDPRTITTMFSSRWKPSASELETWANYISGATNPTDVLERVADGSVSPQELEAVRDLWPKLFIEYQKEIVSNLPEIQKNSTYHQQIKLGLLFDMPINSLMSPENVAFFQTDWAARAEQQQPVEIKQSMNTNAPTQAQSATER